MERCNLIQSANQTYLNVNQNFKRWTIYSIISVSFVLLICNLIVKADELDALPGQKDKVEAFFLPKKINLPRISRKDLMESVQYAKNVARERMQVLEPAILENGVVLKPGSPEWLFASTARTKIISKNYSNTAIVLDVASKVIADKYQLSKEEILYGLPTLDIRESGLFCPLPASNIPCHPGKFRSYNGHCNNVQHPHWGSSVMPFRRDLPADYADGVGLPRAGLQANTFPSDDQPLVESEDRISIATVRVDQKNQRFNLTRVHSSLLRNSRSLPNLSLIENEKQQICSIWKDCESDEDSNSSNDKDIYFTEQISSESLSGKSRNKRQSSRIAAVRDDDLGDSSIEDNLGGSDDLSPGLPDARTVSLVLHTSLGRKVSDQSGDLEDLESYRIQDSRYVNTSNPMPVSAITAVFMQFVFNDIAHVAQSVGNRGHRIRCCSLKNAKLKHPECWPMMLRTSDPLYSQQSCLEYVRSCPTIRPGCSLGAREQINQVTSYLDGSVIYGSSEEEARDLRSFDGGLLQMQSNHRNIWLLPPADGSHDCRASNRSKCFRAGDIRVNEHPGLALMHTIWARQHNRIASKLEELNPHWNDERLFQEARRIIGAQLQHITFNELLPILLGEHYNRLHSMIPNSFGFYYGYDMKLDASVSNSIATSIFPFVYTMLPTRLHRYTDEMLPASVRRMKDEFFDPSSLHDTKEFDQLALGLLAQRARWPKLWSSSAFDSTMNVDIESNTFAKTSQLPIDILAVWLQRSRDHGVPAYLNWRSACNLRPVVSDFNDLKKIMPAHAIRQLRMLYQSVFDIDLFTGGLAEFPLKGALVGPTFACLLGRQFQRIRKGDRFWYENDQPPNRFTSDQLNQIRQTTLANVICENLNDQLFTQPQAMRPSDEYLNAFQRCEDLPNIKLDAWKENVDEAVAESIISLNQRSNIDSSLHPEQLHQAIRNAFAELRNTRNRLNTHQIVQLPSGRSAPGQLAAVLRPKRQAQVQGEKALLLQLVSGQLVASLLNRWAKDEEHTNELRVRLLNAVRTLPQLRLPDYVRKHELNTLSESIVAHECSEQRSPCDHSYPYRTYSGWCNNLLHPSAGTSFHIFKRFLPSVYEDGISAPRNTAKSGNVLPSGRAISLAVHGDRSRLHTRYTLITMQWGQMLDHDLTFTPMNFGLNNSILDCSSCDSKQTVHSECWPIEIPPNDPHFSASNAARIGVSKNEVPRCLHFVRSLNGQNRLGPREQISQVSAYLDGSEIYGSDLCDAKKLRTGSGGLLHSTKHPLPNHKPLLPLTRSNIECRAPSGMCFEAGDLRSSEQPGLATMHTIWLREHNRLAQQLHTLNPHWNDERLYQEARRIVAAQKQVITYREFLPRVLGYQKLNSAGLTLLQSGYYEHYDSSCSATIYNEFSAAVFRFGHSLLRPHFTRLNKQFKEAEQPLKLRSSFFNSDMLFGPSGIDNMLRGLTDAHIEVLDSAITEEVTNHLFEERKKPLSGMDLIALNVQRARDHGLPSYNEYRVKCNLTKAKRFEDLANEMPFENIQRLKSVYEHVDDIDLFPGGMSETSLHGGSVGPTFGCILADQFSRLRKCDRFWFENNDPFVRFTTSQLAEIRKATLAKVVCENSDALTHIQKEVMDVVDETANPRVPCKMLPSINLDFWRDRNSHCTVSGKLINMGQSDYLSPCVMCTCTREGTVCNSMKMQNCFEPMQRFNLNDVLNDSVCQVQCAFSYRLQNYIGSKSSSPSTEKLQGKQTLLDFYAKLHSMVKKENEGF